MRRDCAVRECEIRVDFIVHRPPCRRECVPCLPVSSSGAIIGCNVPRFDAQILAGIAQHRPHRADLRALQREYRIAERRVGGIARRHRACVAPRERLVERLD